MQELKIIAFTHKSIGLDRLGQFHIDDQNCEPLLTDAIQALGLKEIMFLSTCNRVELICTANFELSRTFIHQLMVSLYPGWEESDYSWATDNALAFEGEEALRHLFRVASSIDSLVVGEREIITQVRNAYERCNQMGFTGDLIRMVVSRTIEVAKEVYTKTQIAHRPVSIVSLALQKLTQYNVPVDARVLVIGAGQTNRALTRTLRKRGYTNQTIFNRTLENAEQLATELDVKGFALSELPSHTQGFDVLVSCTGSTETIVSPALYETLLAGDTDRKVIIDLAMPNDVDAAVIEQFPVSFISVDKLKPIAEANLREREKELVSCEAIIEECVEDFGKRYRHRQIELAMREVPQQVNAIREKAVSEVFARDLEQLDDQSKQVIDKMLAYMQKKYNSVTMQMAKEILLDPEDRL